MKGVCVMLVVIAAAAVITAGLVAWALVPAVGQVMGGVR